jgi:hypothetical protein
MSTSWWNGKTSVITFLGLSPIRVPKITCRLEDGFELWKMEGRLSDWHLMFVQASQQRLFRIRCR